MLEKKLKIDLIINKVIDDAVTPEEMAWVYNELDEFNLWKEFSSEKIGVLAIHMYDLCAKLMYIHKKQKVELLNLLKRIEKLYE